MTGAFGYSASPSVKKFERRSATRETPQGAYSLGSTESLRAQLERAALRDQDLDREIAADWFAADEQAWQLLETQEHKKPATPGAEKSTSRRSTRP